MPCPLGRDAEFTIVIESLQRLTGCKTADCRVSVFELQYNTRKYQYQRTYANEHTMNRERACTLWRCSSALLRRLCPLTYCEAELKFIHSASHLAVNSKTLS